jgi:transposase, IS30 family
VQRSQILDATPISEKPNAVEAHLVPVHWKGDLIIGKNYKSALGMLVERTTCLVILVPIKGAKMPK